MGEWEIKSIKLNNKFLSLLLAYLVISLSIVPYIVYADIYSAQATGVDNAAGFARTNDNIRVTSTSLLPASVSFQGNSTFFPMSCSGVVTQNCTYSRQISNISGVYQIVVRESSSLQIFNLSLQTDTAAPVIEAIAFNGLGWGVSATYSIAENGNNGPNSCSGVKVVELYLNNKLSGSSTHPVNNCFIDGSVNGTIPNIIGNVTSAIVVRDYLGNNATALGGTFEIESKPPKIATTVNVFRAGTETKIATIPPNSTVSLDIEFKITEEDLSNEIYASMTDLGLASFVNGECELLENTTYNCKFSNVAAKVSKASPKITIYARDTAGNLANQTITLPLNTAPPTMTIAVVGEKAGQKITMIGGMNSTKSYLADLIFSVKYNSVLELDHVLADLSEITQTTAVANSNASKNITSSTTINTTNGTKVVYPSTKCEKIDDTNYNCTMSGVSLKAQKTAPKITVYAVDESGGRTSQVVTPSFTIVNSAGQVSSISPPVQNCASGTCYLKASGNTIVATISSTSLFNLSDIKINGVAAKCSRGTGSWTCNATIAGSASLALTGFDDFGNPISGKSTAKIVLDTSAPKLLSAFNQTPECPTSGETLVIKANATDSGGSPTLTIYANTIAISSSNLSKQTCSKQGTTSNFMCTLSVSGIISEPTNTAIDVIIEDLAGNQFKQNVPVSVCVKSSERPDFIKSITTRGTVPKVDKKVASKTTLKIPLGLSINLADEQTIIMQRSKVSCSGTPGVGDSYLINENSMNPVLILSLKYDKRWEEYEDEKLPLNCTQDFKIRHGNVIYTNAEIESINANLVLFNQPLGSVNDTYVKKIKAMKENANELGKKIEKWDKVDKTIGNICRTAEKMVKINQVMQKVKGLVWATLVVIKAFGADAGWVDKVWGKIRGKIDKYAEFVDKFVWTGGWKPSHAQVKGKDGKDVTKTMWPGFIIKLTCTAYSCKTYDMNLYTELTVFFLQDAYRNKQEQKVRDQYCAHMGLETGPTCTPESLQAALDKKCDEYMIETTCTLQNLAQIEEDIAIAQTYEKCTDMGMNTDGCTPEKIEAKLNECYDKRVLACTQSALDKLERDCASYGIKNNCNSYSLEDKKAELEKQLDEGLKPVENPTTTTETTTSSPTQPTPTNPQLPENPQTPGAVTTPRTYSQPYSSDCSILKPGDAGFDNCRDRKNCYDSLTNNKISGNCLLLENKALDEICNTEKTSTVAVCKNGELKKSAERYSAKLLEENSKRLVCDTSIGFSSEFPYFAKPSNCRYEHSNGIMADKIEKIAKSDYALPAVVAADVALSLRTGKAPDTARIQRLTSMYSPRLNNYDRFMAANRASFSPGQLGHITQQLNKYGPNAALNYAQGLIPKGTVIPKTTAVTKGTNNVIVSDQITGNAVPPTSTSTTRTGTSTSADVARANVEANNAQSNPTATSSNSGSLPNLGFNDADNPFNFNQRLENAVAHAVPEGSWIFNPYKSKHYDKLCIPAIIFNAQKERQLECRRIGCIEQMAKIGGPIEACEFEYNLDYCLYVESARHKIQPNVNFGRIMKDFGRAIVSNFVGIGVGYAYNQACEIYENSKKSSSVGFDISTPTNADATFGDLNLLQSALYVTCGIRDASNIVKDANEVLDYKGTFSRDSMPTKTNGVDYCQGIEGVEPLNG